MDKELLEKVSAKIKCQDNELLHEDERGKIWRLEIDGKEYVLMYTKKGEVRGGDFHKSIQHDFPITGRVLMVTMKPCTTCPDGEYEDTRMVQPGEEATIKPGIPHMMISFDESLVLEWLDGPFEKEYYRPFRDQIEGKK